MIAQVTFLVALLVVVHANPIGVGLGGIGLGSGLGLGGSGLGLGGSGLGLGGSGLGLGIGNLGGGIALGGIGTRTVDLYAPPKYEYNYAVQDAHTGDSKQQVESRIGDLTRSDYAVGEKDRATRVSRIIAGGNAIGLGAY